MFNDLFKVYAEKQIETMNQSIEDSLVTCYEARIKITSYIQALKDIEKSNDDLEEMYLDYMHHIDRHTDYKIKLILDNI